MLTVFRKEIKYIITIEEYLRIKPALEALMHKDKYGDDGVYMVRSQYYDSIHNRDLADNLSGVQEKRKIRLRIYSPEDQKVKLEYKCKSNTDGVKHSIILTKQEALLMEQNDYSFLLDRPEALAQELYVRMMQGCYRPKTIVVYRRTAYAYPASDVRITFDTELMGTFTPCGLFDKNPALVPMMSQDVGVLEVKYNDYFPSPLKMVIDSINSLSESSSKYSRARMMFTY